MLDIKITLDATSRLECSIYRLCEALERLGGLQPTCQEETPTEAPTAPAERKPELVVNTPITMEAASVADPDPSPVPVAPEAPAYTKEQVCKAGADLITAHPDKLPDLQQLLSSYGVRGVAKVPADKLGEFATALRGLGADL
ncbi:MAG: hypothetical protein LIO95_07365 [Clostridiales bacterium]|nr:hypothetical protein [Clostridiales bacterium]